MYTPFSQEGTGEDWPSANEDTLEWERNTSGMCLDPLTVQLLHPKDKQRKSMIDAAARKKKLNGHCTNSSILKLSDQQVVQGMTKCFLL